MEWLWFIIIGFVAGLIARAIMPGSDAMGWIMTTVRGIAGAFLAGFLGSVLGIYESGGAGGFIAAIIGAIIILAIGRAVTGKRGTTA